MPEENLKRGDKLWVQCIRLTATEERKTSNMGEPLDTPLLFERMPTTYSGNENRSVFDEMDAQLDPVRYPRARRKILGAEVAMRLHKTEEVDGKRLACIAQKTYVIRITERNFTIVERNKIHDLYLLNLFEQLQLDWGFEGLTPEEHKLSKGQPTVKGEANDLFSNI